MKLPRSQSQQFYRSCFECITDGVVLSTVEGSILAANPAACKLFRLTEQELCTAERHSLVDVQSPEFTKFMAQRSRTGNAFGELTLIRGDGTRFSGEVSSAQFFDDQNEPLNILIIRDITESQLANARITASEEKFRTAFMTSADAFYLATLSDGRIIEANESFQSVFGYSREEAIGKTSLELGLYADPIDRQKWVSDMESSGQIRNLKLRGRRKDGTTMTGLLSVSLVSGFRDRTILGVVKDITDHVATQEALRISEEKFRTLFESADDAILLSAGNQWIDCNPAALRIFGCERDQLIDSNPLAFSPPLQPDGRKSEEQALEMVNRSLLNQPQTREWVYCRADGTPFEAEVHLNRVDIEGKPLLQTVVRDISYRKSVEHALRESLEQSIRAIASTIEARDPYTSGHQERVAEIAVKIARDLGLDANRIKGLRLAATIHDLGKIQIPAEILSKPGDLTAIQRMLIQDHPEAGYAIMKDIKFPWPIAEMIRQHHEKFDGSGYPRGLKGDQIILEARILSVADMVDAMSTHRPYRPARPIQAVLNELELGRGIAYDADVVDSCARLIRDGTISLKVDP